MLTHCGTIPLRTKRLFLRKFRYTDATHMLKHWIADQKIQSMYGGQICKDKEAVWELLEKYKGFYKKDDYYRWAIILKGSLLCIGQISICVVDNNHHRGELEYCVGSDFQQKGYATEAIRAVTDFGFRTVNFHRLHVNNMEINHASLRVVEKCGFRCEGMLRDFYYRDEKYTGRIYHSILRDEWESSRLN